MKHAHEHVQALQTPFSPILVLNEDDFGGANVYSMKTFDLLTY